MRKGKLMIKNRKDAKKKGWEKRQQKREMKEKQRKKKAYRCWKYYTRNQKEVAKRISAGDYEIVSGQGWGFFDRFFQFLRVLGFLVLLEIQGAGFERKMMAVSQLLLCYQAKILLGIGSMNAVPETLFKDIGLLKILGFTAKEIQQGTNERWKGRGKEKPSGPMHQQTLANALENFTAWEIELLVNEAVKLLSKHGFIRGSIFALDATDLETTKKYKNCGRVTRKEKRVNKKGQVVEIEVTRYGWKLLILMDLQSRIMVAAKVVAIQEHESQFTLELIKQGEENIGRGKIKIIVMDRGFLDGVTLWEIKHDYGIDFIVPAKENMHVTKDAQSFRRQKADGKYIFREQKVEQIKHRKKKGEKVGGIESRKTVVMGLVGLLTYDQYGEEGEVEKKNSKKFQPHPINALMVLCWKGKEYKAGQEKVFLSSLPVTSPLQVINYYDDRSLIENIGFRELKQGWNLKSYPKKREDAVRNHVLLTVTIFNLCNAFRTEQGQDLTERGIRRFRRQEADSIHKVVVFAGDYYAIFDLEELMTILGKPPKICFRTNPELTKRTYELA